MSFLRRLRQGLHTHSHMRRTAEGMLVALLVSIVFASTCRTRIVDDFELRTLNKRFQTYELDRPLHPDIVVVEITDDDLEVIWKNNKMTWPWNRMAYDLVVQWLAKAGAKAVLFDLSFQDYVRPEQDKKFAETIAKNPQMPVYILATFGAPVQRAEDRVAAVVERSEGPAPAWMKDQGIVTAPFPELIPVAKRIVSPHYDVAEKDPDGVARRYAVGHAAKGRVWLTPGVALAADFMGKPVTFDEKGARIGDMRMPLDGNGTFYLNWHARSGAYNPKRFSVAGIIGNQTGKPAKIYDPADFKGKIVLVGMSAEGLPDFKNSPLDPPKVLGVEVHAMAVDTLLHGEMVRRAPAGATVATVVAFALAAGLVGMLLPLRFSLVITALILLVYLTSAWSLFYGRYLWIDVVSPSASLLFATLGAAVVNYAVEGRQKRDIRNKFGTYLTPEYVKLLEENPGMFKLGGEERVGTAFFSDLSGFTAMSEKMTASELVARMNEYLTLMTRSIKRFKGTVDKYEGDAIVAFWNAPIEQPDHAVLACRAALDNQKELAGLRERWIRDYGVTVVARIGLNTGKMIFGNMGSDEKFNYTMMGDPVNLAARLESANKDYGTYLMIGPDTYEMVKDAMEVRELDLIKVKGKQIPVTVYELLCEKGQLDPRTKEALERYTTGLQAYRMKQFLAAEKQFLEALEIKPDDSPSKLYLERSRKLIATPPAPSWTYIYEKHDK